LSLSRLRRTLGLERLSLHRLRRTLRLERLSLHRLRRTLGLERLGLHRLRRTLGRAWLRLHLLRRALGLAWLGLHLLRWTLRRARLNRWDCLLRLGRRLDAFGTAKLSRRHAGRLLGRRLLGAGLRRRSGRAFRTAELPLLSGDTRLLLSVGCGRLRLGALRRHLRCDARRLAL
jgi:hypothetical protein